MDEQWRVHPGTNSFLVAQSSNSSKPKAFVIWMQFDEQPQCMRPSSGAEQVVNHEALSPHEKNNLHIDKNSYFYMYVSDEIPNIDVYFESLQVSHIRASV